MQGRGLSTWYSSRRPYSAEQPLRTPDQHADENTVDQNRAHAGGGERDSIDFYQSKEQGACEPSHKVAQPAQDDHHKGRDGERKAHERGNLFKHADQASGEPGDPEAQRETDQTHSLDIDTDQHRRVRLLDQRADRKPDGRKPEERNAAEADGKPNRKHDQPLGGFLEGAASIGIHARHHVKPGGSLWRSLLHPVLRYLFASVMAFGLAAVFLLPTVEFAELSNRSVSLSWDDATSGSLVRDELLECVLPRLRGDSMLHGRGAYLPAGDRNSDSATERIVSDYVGATVLLFIIIGLLGPRWRVRFKVIGYTTLGLAGLAVSLGRNLPGLYRILYEYMPGIAHFRSPWTSAALLAFGFVMASTLGLDWLMRKQERERKGERKHAGQTLAVILLLSVFLIITLDVYWGFALPGYPGSVSIPETADSATRGLFLYHALRHLGLSLAGVMLVLAVLVCSMRGRQRTALIVRTACLGLLIFFTSWDLLGNHHVFWNTVRMEPYHRFLERHWAEDIWDREIGPVRVLQTDSVLSNRPLTLTNFDERRLISSVHGYHPVVYGDYFRLYQELGYLHPVFLRLFGVNYLVIPSGQRDVPDGYAPIMDTGSHTLYHHRGQEYVRPVRHISVVRNMDSVIRIMKDKTFDPYYSSLAMIGDAGDEFLGMGGEFPDMQLKYRVDSVAPGEIRLDLKTRSRGMVIISEPAVPGWRMRMEGHDTSAMLTRLDGYFLAFPVEPGSSRVELTYDPVSQRLGLYLTCLSLGFLTFLVIGSPRKSGRGKQVPTRTIPAYWRL